VIAPTGEVFALNGNTHELLRSTAGVAGLQHYGSNINHMVLGGDSQLYMLHSDGGLTSYSPSNGTNSVGIIPIGVVGWAPDANGVEFVTSNGNLFKADKGSLSLVATNWGPNGAGYACPPNSDGSRGNCWYTPDYQGDPGNGYSPPIIRPGKD